MFGYGALNYVFPFKYVSNRTTIRYMVRQLMDPKRKDKDDAPNGTSFAVTVDAGDNMWNLWLSEASKEFLVQQLSHMKRNIIETGFDVE